MPTVRIFRPVNPASTELTIPERPLTSPRRELGKGMQPWIRKHRIGAILLAVLALAGIGGVLVYVYFTCCFTLRWANAPVSVQPSLHGVAAAFILLPQCAIQRACRAADGYELYIMRSLL